MSEHSSSSLSQDRLGWTLAEWSAITGIKIDTIYSQIARKTLKVVKVGGATLVPRRVAVEAGLLDA